MQLIEPADVSSEASMLADELEYQADEDAREFRKRKKVVGKLLRGLHGRLVSSPKERDQGYISEP